MVLAMSRPHKDSRGVYWVRRKVPANLRPLLGRSEYKRSLSTRDPEEAARRFPAIYQESEECFALARAQLAGHSLLNAADIQQLSARWFNQEHDKILRSGDYSAYLVHGSPQKDPHTGENLGSIYESLRTILEVPSSAAWSDAVRPFVEDALSAHRLPLPPASSPLLGQLLDAFKAKLLLLSDWAYSQVHAQGQYIAPPTVEPHAPLSIEAAKKAEQDAAIQLPLSKILEAWADAKFLDDGHDRSTQKTVTEFSTVITRFIELHGDMPVVEITRTTCQDFRASLAQMPTQGRGIRSLTAPQAIARAKTEGLPLASPATVRKQLKALSTILNFASQRLGLIPEDPVSASGLLRSLAKSAKNAETRTAGEKGYSYQELMTIFRSPLFRGEWSPPRADYGKALYWLPLLMVYTGARREELAQLLVGDVCQDVEANCWFIDICPGVGKTLKTHSSRRKIPLHPDLIALGFADYCNSQPADGRLFPKLKPHPVDGYGHAIGKTWEKYLRMEVQLVSKASPSHGFRHAFKTLCRDVGIETALTDWLVGHAAPNVGATYGTYPMRRLFEEVKKFPSIAKEAGLHF